MAEVAADDLADIRTWFEDLAKAVNSLDFEAGQRGITDDFVSFSTFQDIVVGREEAEHKQWRNVWPKTKGFAPRYDTLRAFVSPDRLMAVGIVLWDSIGYDEEGKPYPRPGRATMSFTREKIGDPWRANHGQMSLMRGTPAVSFGAEGKQAAE